jgi:iron complex outermembrane recepter protein
MELSQFWRLLAARFGRLSTSGISHGASFRRLLASGLALGLAASLVAQSGGTGSISGRVFNVGNNRYLNNAQVSVEGTTLAAQTNEYGEYRLDGVPAGEVQVRAQYTGLDTETITTTVAAGGSARLDFNLTNRDRYGEDKTVMLDTFTVAASREFEANAIATNEQRYAPNVKVVMAADAFGDVTEGNAGEFLKYLPGITVDYVAADVRTVSVRGFASNFTNVYLDGMRTTSSASGSSNRVFEFEQVSINNASRRPTSRPTRWAAA